MEPVVLVHLSDIHFTAVDDGEAFRHESTRIDLVNDLARMRKIVGDATAVVVTGDIAFSGASREYERAGEWLDEVSAAVGTDRAKVLTVPGNHDVDYSTVGRSAKLAHEHLRNCRGDEVDKELQELLDDPSRPLLDKLRNYSNFAARYNCEIAGDGTPWETEIPLPGGYVLAVMGLCSVYNSDPADGQRLLLGKRQTTLPARRGKIYLLLAHHGPGDLRDGDAVRDKIKGRAVALLTGHRHAQRVRDVDGCVEVTAGAVNPKDETGWHPSYNWIRIDVDETSEGPHVTFELWHRQWRPEWNEFGAGSRKGDAETWRSPIRDHAVLPVASTTPGAGRTPSSSATAEAVAGDPASSGSEEFTASLAGMSRQAGGAPTGGDQASVSGEHEPDLRPAVQDADGTVPDERRIRRNLFDLRPPVLYAVLAACGLLDDNDWKKDYVSVIADAVQAAAAAGELERLDAAVGDATSGAA